MTRIQSTLNGGSTMLRVLIVDDNGFLRSTISRFLQLGGFLVEEAGDGIEACEVYRDRLRRGESFDVVLSDVDMPRCSGMELFSSIKGELGNCKFVLMSGDVFEERRVRFAKENGIKLLFKDGGAFLQELTDLERNV